MLGLWIGAPRNASAATPDYPGATWAPAASSNYSVANRPHDYPIDMIVIHDIEGTSAAAISSFQDSTREASAHYVVGYDGSITQMVQEKDIAWHAGNWDYNTRSIGIEHAGFACCADYTTAEYDASAHLIASICSRYGVPMDRTHVIGHYQVPDPTNPKLFGGIDHHTDPGSTWDWTTYMGLAQQYAAQLPSPPHMGPYPAASLSGTTATVRWTPARTCHAPISGYTVTEQPGGLSRHLAATATSTSFTGLRTGTAYTFTVTATDADGSDSLASNAVAPGSMCTSASVRVVSPAPLDAGSTVTLRAKAGGCPVPQFQFYVRLADGKWHLKQPWGSSWFAWDTSGMKPGRYGVSVWAHKTGDSTSKPEAVGTIYLTLTGCMSVSVVPATGTATAGSAVTFNASARGCPNPLFAYWLRDPSGKWQRMADYGASSWTWDTTGLAPGAYLLSVQAINKGAYSGTYEAYAHASFSLT